jgi:hypothetical protein
MIGKKLVVLQNGQILHRDKILRDSSLEEWKYIAVQNLKKYSYSGLVATIRLYVHFSNFLKIKYQATKVKIKNMYVKKLQKKEARKPEANKFLKMISEYKYKIRRIKHQIKEEESDLEI